MSLKDYMHIMGMGERRRVEFCLVRFGSQFCKHLSQMLCTRPLPLLRKSGQTWCLQQPLCRACLLIPARYLQVVPGTDRMPAAEAAEPSGRPPSDGDVVHRSLQGLAECLACDMCHGILQDPITAPECMHT